MPRKRRAAREREAPLEAPERPRGVAPEWASAEGVRVQAATGEKGKTYRCPGCQQEIRPGTPHLVVIGVAKFHVSLGPSWRLTHAIGIRADLGDGREGRPGCCNRQRLAVRRHECEQGACQRNGESNSNNTAER